MKYSPRKLFNSSPKDFTDAPLFIEDGSFLNKVCQIQYREDKNGRRIIVLSRKNLLEQSGIRKEDFSV